MAAPFSILGRIGGDATTSSHAPMTVKSPSFSILGRIGGDATRGRGDFRRHGLGILSVSSVGSEAMQLATFTSAILEGHPSFSILGRIGGDATLRRTQPKSGGAKLSVSSVGSEAMQHRVEQLARAWEMHFQYPRSDRRRCNCQRYWAQRNGSGTFSILGRIGGDATRFGVSSVFMPSTFSILGRIGGDATRSLLYRSGRR